MFPSSKKGHYGSYGINAWIHNAPDFGVPDTYDMPEWMRPLHWRSIDVKGANIIPAFGGCMWEGTDPKAKDDPPYAEGVQNGNGMNVFCLNRHTRHVGMNFLDLSVRLVGLKELWTLKWHRNYKLDDLWTVAGGATRSDWESKAPWMVDFKDY